MSEGQALRAYKSGKPWWGEVLNHIWSPRALALGEATVAAACNFAVSIVAARRFDAASFAGYVTALSAVFVAIAFLRVVFVTPSTIRADSWYMRRMPALVAIHFMAIALLAGATTLVLAALALLLKTPLWTASAIAAPGVSLWFMGTEFERGMMIKLRRRRKLSVIVAFQVAALGLLLSATLLHLVPFPVFITCLGLIGVTRSLIGFSGVARPSWRQGLRQLRLGLRRLGPSGMAYLGGSIACSHAPVFALSLLSSPIAAGAFGAMRSLYQPMQIIFRSRDIVNQTRFHSERANSAHSLAHQLKLALWRTAWLSLLLAIALAAAGPWLVHLAYGGRFDAHLPTYWLWGIIMILINLAAISDAYISHSSQHNRYAAVQITAGVTTIGLSLVLVGWLADEGAALAAIAGWSIIIAGGFIVVRRSSLDAGDNKKSS